MSNSYHETFSLLKGMTKSEIDDFLLNEYQGKRLIEKSKIKKQIKQLRKENKENKENNERFSND